MNTQGSSHDSFSKYTFGEDVIRDTRYLGGISLVEDKRAVHFGAGVPGKGGLSTAKTIRSSTGGARNGNFGFVVEMQAAMDFET